MFDRSAGFGSSIQLSSLNGTTGFRLEGIDHLDSSGLSVASAGDVNGDGFSDVIIGAYARNSYAGVSFVVFGKAASFPSAINLANLNGFNGFRLNGVLPNDYSGRAVALEISSCRAKLLSISDRIDRPRYDHQQGVGSGT